MTRPFFLIVACVLACALPVAGQSQFSSGEVVVTASREEEGVDEDGPYVFIRSNVRVYASDGTFSRELATETNRLFPGEPLVLNGTVLVPMRNPEAVERFAADGTRLTPFTTNVDAVRYLSPGRDGGVIASNNSGEVYVFAADAKLTAFRDFTQNPPARGIDLAADGCTLFYTVGGAIARWDSCHNTAAAFVGPRFANSSNAFRLLPDGTFLVAVTLPEGRRVVRVASDGSTIIRTYAIPGNALALDVDRTSFWTNAGNFLLKVDIATGTILSETYTEFIIEGISVVGEPRAALSAAASASVPLASTPTLVILLVTIAAIAMLRVRAI
jgi:hypothetical protein